MVSDFKTQKELKDTRVVRATYFALFVSVVLCFFKFYNYFCTGLLTIRASAMDSLMDLFVSFANFITIQIVSRKKDKNFPLGYDKFASLMTFLQVLFIAFISLQIMYDSIWKLIDNTLSIKYCCSTIEGALMVTVLALILDILLVAYQAYVVKATGSIIIKADMFHYQTDFFSNISILLGLFLLKYFNVSWIDPVVAICFSVYLLFSLSNLFYVSVTSLLDMNINHDHKEIIQFLATKGMKLGEEDLYVLFSGISMKIKLTKHFKNEKEILLLLADKFPSAHIELVH